MIRSIQSDEEIGTLQLEFLQMSTDTPKEQFFNKKLPKIPSKIQKIYAKDKSNALSEVTNEEIRALYFYTTENDAFSYKAINTYLENKSSTPISQEIQFLVEAIDSGLSKLPKFTSACYRGEQKEGRIAKKIATINSCVGKDITPNNITHIETSFFISTSYADASEFYKTYPIKITIIPKDKLRDISMISENTDEFELLYMRESKFFIADIVKAESATYVFLAEV